MNATLGHVPHDTSASEQLWSGADIVCTIRLHRLAPAANVVKRRRHNYCCEWMASHSRAVQYADRRAPSSRAISVSNTQSFFYELLYSRLRPSFDFSIAVQYFSENIFSTCLALVSNVSSIVSLIIIHQSHFTNKLWRSYYQKHQQNPANALICTHWFSTFCFLRKNIMRF